MGDSCDVVIVGGGMVGAALAAGLGDLGYQVTVIERQLPPAFDATSAPDIRVSAINLASELLLKRLKAWTELEQQRIHPYRRLAVWEKLPNLPQFPGLSKRLNQTEFRSSELGTSHLGHIIENLVVQRALLEGLSKRSSVTLRVGDTVKDLIREGERVTGVQLESGECISARLVVGADGALSRIRSLGDLGLREDPYSQHALVIAIAHEGPSQDITWQAFTSHGPLAYLPLCAVGGQTYGSLVWYDKPEALQALLALDEETFMRRVQAEFPETLPTIQAITQKGSFPLVKRHAKRYVAPGLALVGDAAHTINPLAGQGVNLGFQDVVALLQTLHECLDAAGDPGSLETLSTYESRRRMDNLLMMTLMDGFYYAFSNDITPLKWLRNIGLGVAERFTPGKRKVLEYATGLKTLPGGGL